MEVNMVEQLKHKGLLDTEVVRYITAIARLIQFAQQNGITVEEVMNDLGMFQNFNLEPDRKVGSLGHKIVAAYWSSVEGNGFKEATGRNDSYQLEPLEVEQLIQAIDHPVVVLMVRVVCETGIHGRQLLALTGNDVNFSNSTIRIKRDGEYISVVLSSSLISELNKYVRFLGAPSEYPLFLSLSLRPWNLRIVEHLVRKAARKLGWKRPVSLNILRRSYLGRTSQ